MEFTFIDFFFLISFVLWIVIGYGIYRKFYTSIEEIMATTEIKKSRAMQFRAEHLVASLKNSIFFSLILSIGVNLIGLQIYSWTTFQLGGIADLPEFSYFLFLIIGISILIVYPFAELYYLCEKEHEAETPYHKVLRKIIRKLIAKVKGKTEAVFVFGLIFNVIPVLILSFLLDFEILFSIIIVFMIYPLIIIAYFIAYGIYKLFSPAIFLHNVKNLRFYVGLAYIGVIILFELGIYLPIPEIIFFTLLSFLGVLIYGIVKDLRYRPHELAHIIDDVTRPFEWVHGSFLVFGFTMFAFILQKIYTPVFSTDIFVFLDFSLPSITRYVLQIHSILIPLFLLIIIWGKSKSYSRALVVSLTYDSMKLNAAIKSKFIHDKTLIETIEKSVNQDYIRPEYTPKLYRLLKNTDVHVRRKAIILLRKITEDDRFKSVSIVPNLLDFLKKDKIWTVRLEATESLTNMMKILPKTEVKNIYEFLSGLKPDKNRYVRWGIIRLFSSIGFAREDKIKDVMEVLFKGLEDDEWSVRKGTVESFNQLVTNFPDFAPQMLGKSLKLLTDEDTDIVKELFQLIQNLTGIEVKEENLQQLESGISDKIGPEFEFDVNLLKEAIEKIKELDKPPKFVFKRSQLKK